LADSQLSTQKTDHLKLRRFKLHDLAFAMSLASLVLVEQSAYADVTATPAPTSADNPALDAPLNYGFYTREQLTQLPENQRIRVPASCRGVWVTPLPNLPNQPKVGVEDANTTTRSDSASYDPVEGSMLKGNVRLSQPDRLLVADKVTVDPGRTIVTATGNVKIADPGFLSVGESAIYHLDTRAGSIKNSQFIASDRQAHGSAAEISRADNLTQITDSVYSTCEPDSIGWKLKSRQLNLNQETGRGVARDATLYIGSVPIFYIPYFNFPIDSRRASGVLIPSLRYNAHNGVDVAVPYYLNLAPNYDALVTPRIVSNRNPMLNGEFRFLNPFFGSGTIAGGFLPNDPKYNDLDRKELSFQDRMRFGDHWSSYVNLNYVSDKDFFSDLGQTIGPVNNLNEERSATLNYSNAALGLSGFLQALNYQQLDKTIPDINRPYGRVQLQLNYDQGSLNGLEWFATNNTGYFQREVNDGSGPQINGIRQFNSLGIKYNERQAGGYAIPTVSIRTLAYQDENNSDNETITAAVPQFMLDSGLVFQRQAGSYLQTLEPRLVYAYSPYVNQNQSPIFDTTYASSSFNQLFSPSRFIGSDRLDDNNFATMGVTSRFYDDAGLEKFRIGVADRFYLSDRRVTLTPTDAIGTARSSGVGLDLGAAWSRYLRFDSSTLFTEQGRLAVNVSDAHYYNTSGQALSLGYIFRRTITQDNQIGAREATASFVQPVYNNFRILGSVQYDYQNRVARDALIGVDYDSCCWSVALYGRSYYNDYDNPAITNASRGVMVQVTFKGLASNSESAITEILKQKIYGFTQVDSSWQNR
jgi:LPS-assembly protein